MPEPLSPGLDDFGRRLREAAERQMEEERDAERRTTRRRRRRTLVAGGVAVLLPTAAIAGAGSLLSRDGEPLKEERRLPAKVRPASDPTVIRGSAALDPDGGPPWALRLFENEGGEQCLTVGRLQNGVLGQFRGSDFRPLPASVSGVCDRLAEAGLIVSVERRTTPRPRTVVYGLVDGREPVDLRLGGERLRARPETLGSFVVVLRGVRDTRNAVVSTQVGARRVVRELD